MKSNEKIIQLAKALAVAYWRGRLDNVQRRGFEDGVIERMLSVAGDADWERWRQTAKVILDSNE